MDSTGTSLLTTLLVFRNAIKGELIRSVHVYRLRDGRESEVEREFVFSRSGSYGEMRATPILRLQKFRISEVSEGYQNGVWLCVFAFHADHKPQFSRIPSLLSVTRKISKVTVGGVCGQSNYFSLYSSNLSRRFLEQESVSDVSEIMNLKPKIASTPSRYLLTLETYNGHSNYNPKLQMIPTLLNDLHMIHELDCKSKEKNIPQISPDEKCQENGNDCHQSRKILLQDLNCLPYPHDMPKLQDNEPDDESLGVSELPENEPDDGSLDTSDLPDNDLVDETLPGNIAKKKRAANKDVASIGLADLVKYFDVPIVEASKNLKVGLTVLKRKCREFGIPRWPHRKIKSLDNLIHDLQDVAENEEIESDTAVMAVTKRQRMLESEKEIIERKPSMDIQRETKRFRQDVFKRRHRARAMTKQRTSASSSQHLDVKE